MTENYQLRIDESLAAEIRRHGERTYPQECCGALLGHEAEQSATAQGRRVIALFPLDNRNSESPRNRFSLEADDVRGAEAAAHREKLEVLGWYHSHPDHPAQPSEFDRQHAWPWYSYIIVSIEQGAATEMTSWRLNNDRASYSREKILLSAAADERRP
jgi:proteasome lid subunit RPN8/RPN11